MTELHKLFADDAAATTRWEFLQLHGTPNQLERHLAGLLPEDELLGLVRGVLFAPFAEYKRWIKLSPGDLMHRRGCRGGEVTFTTCAAPDLTDYEWSRYKVIRDAVYAANLEAFKPYRAIGEVELVEHVGVCSLCGSECSARSVSVRIEWAGRPLSREYSLEET